MHTARHRDWHSASDKRQTTNTPLARVLGISPGGAVERGRQLLEAATGVLLVRARG